MQSTPRLILLCLPVLLLFQSAVVLAAETGIAGSPDGVWIELCPSRAEQVAVRQQREYLQIDGTSRWLRLTDDPSDNCVSRFLGAGVNEVRWFGLIPDSKAEWLQRGFILQGLETAAGVQISDVEVSKPVSAPKDALPVSMDLLDRLHPRIFGIEARAKLATLDGGLQLLCAPGERPAGLVLRNGGARLPGVIDLSLQVGYQADARFGVAYADAPDYPLESPYLLGYLDAQAQSRAHPLPAAPAAGSDRDVSFTFTCPNAGGRLALSSLQVTSTGHGEAPARSIWIWRPSEWLNQPDVLLAELTALSTPIVYVSVLINADGVEHADALAAFIGMADEAGIDVWAVEGDPHAVLPAGRAAFARRAAALSSFNASQPPERQLRGVQYDIEPYLLPDFTLHTGDWLDAYVQTIAGLSERLDVPLEIAVPFWWSSLTVEERSLLDELAPHIQGLNVMNYRTDPALLQQFAEPFLTWGAAQDVAVRIALEAGPIQDEARWHYRPASEASKESTLWHLPLGGDHLLLLFSEPAVVPSGMGYQFVRESAYSGSRLTFKGDLPRMDQTMAELERLWSGWPSFAGLALHEYRLRKPE